jgi:glutathione synthase/RimK-type ligase-like ATP-grasp enzyme
MKIGILVRRKETLSVVTKGKKHLALEIKESNPNVDVKFLFLKGPVPFLKKDLFKKAKKEVDIVYDNCFPKGKKESLMLKKFHKDCRDNKLPIFNTYQFITTAANKWRTYNFFLKKDKFLKNNFIPSFLNNKRNLLNLINNENKLILKPIMGQEGIGIIKLEKKKDCFVADYSKNCGGKLLFASEKIKDISQLNERLKTISDKKKYILQPEIDIARINGRIFDVRVMMQKLDKWQINGLGARVAAANKFISNIHAGGEIFFAEDILRKIFPKNYAKIIDEISSLSLLIANLASEHIGNLLGEMGIDLLIDKEGKIWCTEVNSKPGYYLFYKSYMGNTRKKIVNWPVEFSLAYLKNKIYD